jgi:hypothetical protein
MPKFTDFHVEKAQQILNDYSSSGSNQAEKFRTRIHHTV